MVASVFKSAILLNREE